jgi:hypothetical protein
MALSSTGARPPGRPVRVSDGVSATDVRLDGDEIAADADDGDASDTTTAYMLEDCLAQPVIGRPCSPRESPPQGVELVKNRRIRRVAGTPAGTPNQPQPAGRQAG